MTKLEDPKKVTFWIVWNGACNEGFVTDDNADALSLVGAIDPQDYPSSLAECFAEIYDGDAFTITEITLEDRRGEK